MISNLKSAVILKTAFTFFGLIPKWFLPSSAPSLQHVLASPLYKNDCTNINCISFHLFFYCSRFFLQIWKIQPVGIVSHMWCRYNMHHVPHSYVSWLSISIPDIKVLPFERRFFKHHEFVCLPKCELWPCLTSFCPLLADRELFISWMFGFCHRQCNCNIVKQLGTKFWILKEYENIKSEK